MKSQQKRIELVTRLGMYAAEEERIKYIATKDKEAMKQATDSIVTSGASLRKRCDLETQISNN